MGYISRALTRTGHIVQSHRLIALFLLCLIVFNANLRPIGSGDTTPAALLPFSILDTHTLYFDSFVPADNTATAYMNVIADSYFFTRVNGHYLSIFPIALPVLLTPLYIVPYIALKLAHVPVSLQDTVFHVTVSIMEKFAASTIAALSVVFVYAGMRKLFDGKVSLLVALIYAFATSTWAVSSQALWQHGAVELLVSMLIFLILADLHEHKSAHVILMAALTGLLFAVRPPDVVLAIPAAIYVLSLRDVRSYMSYAIAGLATWAPFAIYNEAYFGSLVGWYKNNLEIMSISDGHAVNAFFALLASPNKGILVLSPVLLLSILGLIVLILGHRNIRWLYSSFLFSILLAALVYSVYDGWWGGWCYGYRYLAGALPLFAYLMGVFFQRLFDMKSGSLKTLLCIMALFLIAWSVAIQAIGVFYYPNGDWNSTPNIDYNVDRVWDYHDLQVLRTFCAGPYPIYGQLAEHVAASLAWPAGTFT